MKAPDLRRRGSGAFVVGCVVGWRGAEGDLVAESDDGRVVAFEVKASERAAGPALTGLTRLRDLLGPRLVAGIVLTTGAAHRSSCSTP